MLTTRSFRLRSFCRRVVLCSGEWRTLTGHRVYPTQALHWAPVAPSRLYHRDLGQLYKTESLQRHLRQLVEELRDINRKLQRPYVSESDRKELSKRRTALLPLATAFERSEQAAAELQEVISLLQSQYLFCFCHSW